VKVTETLMTVLGTQHDGSIIKNSNSMIIYGHMCQTPQCSNLFSDCI